MKTKKLHTVIIFLLVWGFSFAQKYKNYSISNGLPSNHVYRITQDYNGFIWFVTDKGMVKFDGKVFKIFTTKDGLPNNDIWDIKITKDNRVWYISKSEKLGFIENDKVFTFPASKKGDVFYSNNTGQAGDSIIFHCNSSNYILKDSVFLKKKIRKANLERILAHRNIKNLEWTEGHRKLHFLDKNDFRVWSPSDLTLTDSNTKMNGQLNDSLYAISDKNKVVLLNFYKKKYYTLEFKNFLKYKEIKYQRLHNVNKEVQITGSHFVGKVGNDHAIGTIHYIPENLDSHFSFIDKTGNIWAATFNNGVYFFPVSDWHTTTYFSNQKLQQVKKIGKNIWISLLKKGLYKYQSEVNTFKRVIHSKDYAFGISHLKRNNEIIYSTENYIFRYKDNNLKEFDFTEVPFEKNNIGRRFVEHNKALFSNVHAGINKLHFKTLETEEFFPEFAVSDMASLQENLLIGTSSGLKYLHKNTVKSLEGNSLFQHPILSMKNLNKSNVVVGTDGFGAYIYSGNKAMLIKDTEKFSIQDIVVENENSIWFATQKGVHNYKTKLGSFYRINSFFESDGLLANKINSIAIQDNLLYTATDIGLTALDITRNYKSQLQGIYIGNVKFDEDIIEEYPLVMDYSSSASIQIEYGIIDYSNQDNVKKEYRLLPHQKSWIETSSNQINLNSLMPNSYTLELRATNHHGEEVSKNISILVKPRFWQERWFKIILGIFIGTVLTLSVWFISKRIQLKKDKKIMQERELSEMQLRALRSQMNPHFVFNSLAAIQYYINDNDFRSSEVYLVKFSKLIRQFFELSKENEILLSEEIKLLQTYLEIEKLRFTKKLDFKINTDYRLDNRQTSIPTMLLQPIVENAINHGIFNKEENGMVTLNFIYIDQDTFRVDIIDDGVGFSIPIIRIGKKEKSSNVLKDRIHFLNKSGSWYVTHSNEEMYPNKKNKGNKTTFTINHIKV